MLTVRQTDNAPHFFIRQFCLIMIIKKFSSGLLGNQEQRKPGTDFVIVRQQACTAVFLINTQDLEAKVLSPLFADLSIFI